MAFALAPALAALALALPLAGKTIAIDPGHNGGNAAHAGQIARLVDAGTLRKACDTVGAESADGYAEHAHNLDVSRRLARSSARAERSVVLARDERPAVWGPYKSPTRAAIGNRERADDGDLDPRRRRPCRAAAGSTSSTRPAVPRGCTVTSRGRPPGSSLSTCGCRSHDATGEPYADLRRPLRPRRPPPTSAALNLSNVPKVFVEAANMRNAADARRLESPAYRRLEAASLRRAASSASFAGSARST